MKKDIEKALMEFLMDVRTTGQERKKGIPLITFVYKEKDITHVKVGGEPSGFWEHGSLHLGNSSVGRSVTYVMS